MFCITSISAQDLSFGFKAGLNFSRINTEDIEQSGGVDLESYSGNSGFHLGVVVSNKITDNFGVRGELLFSQKGGRYEFCLLYTSPSPRDLSTSRMPSSA